MIVVDDDCGCFDVNDPYELWRLMWGAVTFAMALERNGGSCPGCGCRVNPCLYCLHECWIS